MGNYHARCGAGEKPEVETPEAYLSLFGKIPEFPSKISTCRKYNISVTVILQDLPQIKTLYKDDYETIISNCDSTVVLGVNDQTTAKYLSEFQLGKGTIKARSVGHRKGKAGNNMNFQQTGRELMTQDETRVMDNDYCIVIVRGILPFYDKKYDLTRHPRYKETGDFDDSLKVEVTEAEEFYNFTSEVYDREAVKEEEPEEAAETLSIPQKVEKEGIGGSFDSLDLKGKVEAITPMERKDMIAYLTQCRATADKCIAEAKKIKSEIFCCYIPVSYSMGPAYTTQCFSDNGRKPVVLFFNSVHNGYMEGYFIDPTDRVKDIFNKLGCGKISPVKDYGSGDYQLYAVTSLKTGDYNMISGCMRLGFVIDDTVGDRVEELMKGIDY